MNRGHVTVELGPIVNWCIVGVLAEKCSDTFPSEAFQNCAHSQPLGPVSVLGTSQTRLSSVGIIVYQRIGTRAWNNVKQYQVLSISMKGDYSADVEPVV